MMIQDLCPRLILFTAIASIAACANTSRSRDLANAEVSGQTLAQQVCSNCHGVGGIAVSPNFPNLAAQQKQYFVAQLAEFKSHHREDPAGFEYMWGIVRTLTDKQIEELADYFAAQQPMVAAREGDPTALESGRVIFLQGIPALGVPACATCHGENGAGKGPYPRLAGQHVDYLVKQLSVFQRTNERPAGAVMKVVAHQLTHADIRAVSVYAQSLAPGLGVP
ncbi:MAG: c-type cytochrome [Rudaea sp.]